MEFLNEVTAAFSAIAYRRQNAAVRVFSRGGDGRGSFSERVRMAMPDDEQSNLALSNQPRNVRSRQRDAVTTTPAAICWICGNPVPLEHSKTDEHGHAVHEECYVTKMKQEKSTSLPARQVRQLFSLLKKMLFDILKTVKMIPPLLGQKHVPVTTYGLHKEEL